MNLRDYMKATEDLAEQVQHEFRFVNQARYELILAAEADYSRAMAESPPYSSVLRKLEGAHHYWFSHYIFLWWQDDNDKALDRRTNQIEEIYAESTARMWASHNYRMQAREECLTLIPL